MVVAIRLDLDSNESFNVLLVLLAIVDCEVASTLSVLDPD